MKYEWSDESMNDLNNLLTNDELEFLRTLVASKEVEAVGAPVRPVELKLDRTGSPVPGELLVAEQRGLCRLSEGTRKRELARIAKREEWRRNRGRKVRRARGQFHHRRKERTQRLRREKRWKSNPFGCILNMDTFVCKRLDRGVWDERVAPLWEKYNPKNLTVKFPAKAGTKANPWTLYNMDVWLDEGKGKKQRVYRGEDWLLWDLGNAEPSMNN